MCDMYFLGMFSPGEIENAPQPWLEVYTDINEPITVSQILKPRPHHVMNRFCKLVSGSYLCEILLVKVSIEALYFQLVCSKS